MAARSRPRAAKGPTVFVVDNDEAMRGSLRRLLTSKRLRVELFDCAQAFLDGYNTARAGCLVLDLKMPGMTGMELQQELIGRGIRLPIIFITAHADVPQAVKALRSGAVDFLEKPYDPGVLLERIHEAIRMDQNARRRHADTVLIRERINGLTPRQREVLELLAQGKLNKQIAYQLRISSKTVEFHRGQLMKRMQANNVAELVQMVMVARSVDDGQPAP